jgi:hypothetical protein
MTTTTSSSLTVTLTAPYKRVVFTWAPGAADPTFTAAGVSDDELDRILAARGHEGADVEGFETELS